MSFRKEQSVLKEITSSCHPEDSCPKASKTDIWMLEAKLLLSWRV